MCQGACKPGSVLQAVCSHTSLAAAAIHLGEGSLPALKQPTRTSRNETLLPCGARPLFGLAPGGVCHAGAVTSSPGALLPHPFTLACEV